MPTTSTIYKFPSPATAESSNGPAAFTSLGARVEREMTVFRGQTMAESETPTGMGFTPAWTLVHTSDHAVAIIGWIDVTSEVAIKSTAGANTNIAGQWRILGNGAALAQGRWHNYAGTALINKTLQGALSLAAVTTNVTIRIEIQADLASSGAIVQYARTHVRRYGAPATG